MCIELQSRGYKVAPYHAGWMRKQENATKTASSMTKVDTIVATIAFGMGIDKSNVRYVIHTGHAQVAGKLSAGKRPGRTRPTGSRMLHVLFRRRLRHLEIPDARYAARGNEGWHGQNWTGCTGSAPAQPVDIRKSCNILGRPSRTDNCAACDICLGETDDSIEERPCHRPENLCPV